MCKVSVFNWVVILFLGFFKGISIDLFSGYFFRFIFLYGLVVDVFFVIFVIYLLKLGIFEREFFYSFRSGVVIMFRFFGISW